MIRKTFRLFISSTFSDFLKERKLLNTRINSALENFCAERGFDFQIIDLRWGVSTESALNQRTMDICLNEVRRCLLFSPKPNFLLLVGERYGWIPLPSKIQSDVFERLYANIPEKDRFIVNSWYQYDANSLEGDYVLRKRNGVYAGEKRWTQVYNELRRIFCAALQKETNNRTHKLFELSATEQEVYEGLFATDASNVIAVFRENSFDCDEDITRIQQMKTNISNKMTQTGHKNS